MSDLDRDRFVQNKIYISDLDGTLLRNDASLSSFSKNTLIELIDRGLIFTVATARSIASVREILRGLKLNLPVIEFRVNARKMKL